MIIPSEHQEQCLPVQYCKLRKMGGNPSLAFNTKEASMNRSKRNTILYQKGILGGKNAYSRCERGWFDNGVKRYYMRSKWEMNYACYLDFLLKFQQIKEWEYEIDTFWFNEIKRGVRSYKPDFKIFNNNGSIEYHEVKGWMDSKSKTKLKRMKKYYPNVKLIVIGESEYRELSKQKNLFKGWE